MGRQSRTAGAHRRPGRIGGSRALAIVLAAAAVAASILTASGAIRVGSAEAASPACHDIYFLSLRGSGEVSSGQGDANASKRTAAVFRGLTTELKRTGKSQDIEFRQLSTYKAPSVKELVAGVKAPPVVPSPAAAAVGAAWVAYTTAQILKVNVPHYLSGELDGETELITSMTDIRDVCKRVGKVPEVFVSGYSQGAMAAHSVIYRLDQSSSSLAPLLTGAALVADPFRVPNSQLVNYGDAPRAANSWGICHALDDLPGRDSCRPGQQPGTAIPIPQRSQASTVEVCDAGDAVCDTSQLLRTPRIDRVIQNAINVHTACPANTYCGDQSEAAGRALATLSKKPASTTPTPPTTGPTTEPTAPPPTSTLKPGLSAAEGPPGLGVYAVAPDKCPPSSEYIEAAMLSPDRTLVSRNTSTLTKDGNQANVIAIGGQQKGRYEPPPSATDQSPPGMYTVQISCKANSHSDGQDTTQKIFPELPYKMLAPYTVRASATSVQTTKGLRVSSIQPCPAGSVTARARLSKAWDISDRYPWINADEVRVAPDGSWSADFPDYDTIPDGDYGLYAECVDGDLFTTMAYGLSAVISLERPRAMN